MAEGDTIHRTARRLEAALAGRSVTGVSVPSARSPLRRQTARLEELRAGRVQGAEARGKHLLIHIQPGLVLHAHLGMHGSWQVRASGSQWRRPLGTAWLVLSADGGVEAAQFGGSRLDVRTEGELRSDPRLASLGPDLLDPAFETSAGVAALRAARQDRAVGEALLDQSLVAGVGNVYKSEGCFAAAVDPWRALGALDDAELERVVDALRRLMRTGVERGRPPRQVYRRARQPCTRCGTPVRSRGQGDANRTTYWCPGCQR
jgi:endonuclease VIII